MGKHRKSNSTKKFSNKIQEEVIDDNIPRSLVFSRGTVAPVIDDLVSNLKNIFKPYTYDSLRVKRSNSIKDFLSVSGALGLTHMIIFSSGGEGTNMRIIKTPQGPTLYFRLVEYSTVADLQSNLKLKILNSNEASDKKLYDRPPLCILSGFNKEIKENEEENEKFKRGMSLAAVTFKGLFPSVDVATTSTSDVRRALLFAVDEDGYINLRHYAIKLGKDSKTPEAEIVALTKKLVKGTKINLSNIRDFEDLKDKTIEVDKSNNELNKKKEEKEEEEIKTDSVAISLKEIGPRITLELIKVETGVNTGSVIYHSRIDKTPAQIKFLEQNALKAKSKIEKKEKADYNSVINRLRQEKIISKKRKESKEKAQEELENHAMMKEAEMDEHFENDDKELEKERLKALKVSDKTNKK